MARDEHNKAAEHHENAAKAHRSAAEHNGKGDHAKITQPDSIQPPASGNLFRGVVFGYWQLIALIGSD